jgi:hypothetical protein
MGSEEVCVFQASPTTIVTLTLFTDPSGAANILQVRKQLAGASAFPVTGLGPDAFRLAMSSANSIVFGKDQTVARLEVATAVTSDTALLERLARTAYERMPMRAGTSRHPGRSPRERRLRQVRRGSPACRFARDAGGGTRGGSLRSDRHVDRGRALHARRQRHERRGRESPLWADPATD